MARRTPRNVPVIAICGSLGKDYEVIYHHGIDSVFSIMERPCHLDEALKEGALHVKHTTTNIARLLQLKIEN